MGVVCSAAYFRCPVSDWKGFKLLMRVERVPTTWLTFTLLFRDGRGMESLHSEAKYKHLLFVLLVVFFHTELSQIILEVDLWYSAS